MFFQQHFKALLLFSISMAICPTASKHYNSLTICPHDAPWLALILWAVDSIKKLTLSLWVSVSLNRLVVLLTV